MSQNESNAHLLQLWQDRIATEKLSALGTRLGTWNRSRKRNSMHRRSRSKLQRSKIDELSHTYFIEHIMCVTNKLRAKHKEMRKTQPLIWRLKNTTDFHMQIFTLKQKIDKVFTVLQTIQRTLSQLDLLQAQDKKNS
jgi:transcription initiation factor IIF auxiliary subunit